MPIRRRGFGAWEEKARDQRKGCQHEILMPSLNIPIGFFFRSWMWDARDRRKDGRICGVPHHRKGREDCLRLVLSYPGKKGGSYGRMYDIGKG